MGAQRVTVVGAGVVGLSCAVRLAEAGYAVDVLARELPLETTSAVAGGLWLPYLAQPVDDVVRWSLTSLDVLTALAGDDGAHGVRLVPGTLLQRRTGDLPEWFGPVGAAVPRTAVHDPAPGYPFGWGLAVPLADLRRYLPWLGARLERLGGTITRLALPALPGQGLVVNCTGLAARALAADPSVHPVRGQVVLVADPGLDRWWVDETGTDLTYVLPRGRDVVLGGTAQDGSWELDPDPDTTAAILARATTLEPRLAGAAVLGQRVGLRPGRPRVRVESDGERVVHCYGHGGAGFTASWGCAQDVVGLVDKLAA